MIRQLFSVGALALSLAACGGSDDRPPPPSGCTGSYSGALSGAFDCSVDATFDGTDTAINVYATDFSGSAWDLVPAEIGWTGAPAPGTYTEATSGVASLTLVYSATEGWVSARNSFTADLGTFTLVIESATPIDGGPAYEVHGSFEATLELYPVEAASPDVTLAFSF